MWGNSFFDFAFSSTRGISGGIFCVWNSFVFQKIKVFSDENFVAVEGVWHPINTLVMFVSSYAPQSIKDKRNLWLKLLLLIKKWNTTVLFMGY
uniref:Uncharacterized protein n=1 Tax=Lactuca sativa TaxID=4236 RepID=A0A9R1UXP8_LACSA|nr:hypothetical protein LSAT_V11C700351780 [Lactuca sativa]